MSDLLDPIALSREESIKEQLNERKLANEECVKDMLSPFNNASLTLIIVGASGHLARTKTYPAIYALYIHGLLPKNTKIVGYARSKLSNDEFYDKLLPGLKKKSDEKYKEFLTHCTYYNGQYNSKDDFNNLNEYLNNNIENGYEINNRIFYMAIPPNLFDVTAESIKYSAMSKNGWNRIIVEKPFGKDLNSYRELSKSLLSQFTERQIYRIDHYLGKEMVQNLMVLRFSNLIFQPTWNRDHIQSVMITFKEADGVEGRGGYFDQFGILRDVAQNHLMQILTLFTMEQPASLHATDIRDEKVKALRSIEPINKDDVIVGQYVGNDTEVGYTQDPSVPNDSKTPTYGICVLYLKNPRWQGVPFILKCGKGLNERKAEVRIQFKPAPGSLYQNDSDSELPLNELVMRLQPSPAIWLKFMTKSPGLSENIETTELDLTYNSHFDTGPLPDAYERLILDVIKGDHRLFVRNDELEYSWKLFTPILEAVENGEIPLTNYIKGSRGPDEADELTKTKGFKRIERNFTKRKNVY